MRTSWAGGEQARPLPCFIPCFSCNAGWIFSICFVRKSILRLKNALESSTFWKCKTTTKKKMVRSTWPVHPHPRPQRWTHTHWGHIFTEPSPSPRSILSPRPPERAPRRSVFPGRTSEEHLLRTTVPPRGGTQTHSLPPKFKLVWSNVNPSQSACELNPNVNPAIADQRVEAPRLYDGTTRFNTSTTDRTAQDSHNRLDGSRPPQQTGSPPPTKGYRAGQRNEQFFTCDIEERVEGREGLNYLIQTAIIVFSKRDWL